jgi:energy-coupling factor transport system substrate-specific component
MSWQLDSFALIALGLAGGFAWYERVRPDARIVALVGTLAAFAALGRIAFAALPNVKPTTDIVLISGYALGGAPGFVVGALAGLTSNFFFGQGPWTPWQMAAWGVVGVLGAGLALITARRIGRWPLAIVCFVVGFAFTAVQDVGDWVNYSDHSLASLGVYVGKGLGFDAVHAAGCFAFALAFGPALTRSIQRFATRLQVTWLPSSGVAAPVLVAGLLLASMLGPRATPIARAASTPAGYLLAAENRDGGFGPAPGQSSSQLYSGWAALGLAAAGENLHDVARDGHALLAYLAGGVRSLSDPGSLERTILVVGAADLSPRSFGGRDLVAALARDVRPNGSVADQVNLTAFAMLALRAVEIAPARRTFAWLVRQQDRDGGFNFASAGGSSDVDDTGAVLEALAGPDGPAANVRRRAVRFVLDQQNRDGGFPSQPGGESNAQSTAWAVQGLLAAGIDPSSPHRGGAVSPLRYLSSLVGSDGHIQYARGVDQTPVWVTAEALLALARKPLPLPPMPAPAPAQPTHGPARPGANPPRAAAPSTSHPAAGAPHPAAAGAVHPAVPASPAATPSAHTASGSAPRATPSRPGAGAGAGSLRGAGAAGSPRRDSRAGATPPMLAFATYAALATAVLLAPVGLG